MPEMHFTVRWPDGNETVCYSPSLVVEEHLGVGAQYSLDAFVEASTTALSIASDRVAARYGFACSRALGQIEAIRREAQRHAAAGDAATVTVLRFERL